MVARSLNRNVEDAAKICQSREPLQGRKVSPVLHSCFPFFFTREAASLPLAGIYQGAACFLIASGPSFKDIDTSLLKGRWSMTLNNAHSSYKGQAHCSVDDPSRFSLSMWLDPTIQKFVPMEHFEKALWDNRLIRTPSGLQQLWEKSSLRVGDCPNVIGFRRNSKFHASRWLHEDTINWGNHQKFGGGRSVLLASLRILYLLGFRTVNLLGVDFRMDDEYRYHFQEDRSLSAVKCNNSTYGKLKTWLAELNPFFLKAGFQVFNCNPTSNLTVFPFRSFEEAAAEAVVPLGDHTAERTIGMYSPLDERPLRGPEQVMGYGPRDPRAN